MLAAASRAASGRWASPALRAANGARQLADCFRQRKMVLAELPTISRRLDFDSSWRVHRIFATVGDVTVATLGGRSPAAVLKVARSAEGSAALRRSGAVVEALRQDPRLRGWDSFLPARLGATLGTDGHLVVLEQLLPGQDGYGFIRRADEDALLASVLETIRVLHAGTASETTIDDRLLCRCVDAPIAVLEAWYVEAGVRVPPGLEELRLRLRQELLGRTAMVGWTHGDLAPRNVLFHSGTLRVSGLLDWERATANGLPEVDEVHLRLTSRTAVSNQELGHLVCQLLEQPAAATQLGVTGDCVMVLLTWLHHVSGIVAKSHRYGAGGVWATRNVEPVLSSLAAGHSKWSGSGSLPGLRGPSWRR